MNAIIILPILIMMSRDVRDLSNFSLLQCIYLQNGNIGIDLMGTLEVYMELI